MITNPKLGLKVAQCPEEALWEKVRRSREESIRMLEDNLTIEKEILKLAKTKLKKFKP